MTEKFNAANTSFLLGKSYRRKVFLVNLYMLSNTLLDPNILSRVDKNSSEYNGEKLAEKEGDDEENLFRLLKTEEGDKHLLSMKQVLLDEYGGSIDNLKEAFKSTDNSDKDDIENYFSEIKEKAPKKEVEKNYYGINEHIHNSDKDWEPEFIVVNPKLQFTGEGEEKEYIGKDIITGETIKAPTFHVKEIIEKAQVEKYINSLTEAKNKKDAEAAEAGEAEAVEGAKDDAVAEGKEPGDGADDSVAEVKPVSGAPAASGVDGAAGEVAGDDSVGAEAPGAAPAAPVDNSGAVEGEVAKEKNTDIQFIITEMDDKNDFANSIEVQENGKTIIEKLSKGDIMSYTSSDGNTKRYINILGLNDKEINYEEFDYSESEQEWKWYYSISKGMMKVANPTRILSNHSDNKYRKGIEWNKFTNLKKEENITTKKQAEKEAKAAAAPGTETPVAVTAPGDNNNEKLEKIKNDEKEAAQKRDASLKVNENNSRVKTQQRLYNRNKESEESKDDGSGSKNVNEPSPNLTRRNSIGGGSRKKNKTKKTRKSRKK